MYKCVYLLILQHYITSCMILVQLSSISCCWDCMIIPWAGLENVWQGQERESSFENCDNASLSDLPCKMFLNACTAFYEAPVLHCKGVCQCHAAGGEYALGWRRWTPINPSTPKVFHVKFSQRKTGERNTTFYWLYKWPSVPQRWLKKSLIENFVELCVPNSRIWYSYFWELFDSL